jgi:hypothetical protein
MIIHIRHWKLALRLTLEVIVFAPLVTTAYDYSNLNPIYCILLYKISLWQQDLIRSSDSMEGYKNTAEDL